MNSEKLWTKMKIYLFCGILTYEEIAIANAALNKEQRIDEKVNVGSNDDNHEEQEPSFKELSKAIM